MSKYVAWFKDLNKDSIAIAGGKGSNLAEMVNLHLPVPNGFAVTAQGYKEFIERTKIKDKIQHNNRRGCKSPKQGHVKGCRL
jgi:pyruvate,water dikinase